MLLSGSSMMRSKTKSSNDDYDGVLPSVRIEGARTLSLYIWNQHLRRVRATCLSILSPRPFCDSCYTCIELLWV